LAFGRKDCPFFFDIQQDIKAINGSPDRAIDELIARNPVFYKKTMFRAFLNLSKEECDNMSIGEYMDYSVALDQVLKLWHAPFQKE
jgi:hypothetical protein